MKRSATTGFCQIKHGKSITKETTMGKVSDWLIEMEEDASYMTRQEFIDKHGETVIDLYDELQLKWQYDHAEPGEPDDVG